LPQGVSADPSKNYFDDLRRMGKQSDAYVRLYNLNEETIADHWKQLLDNKKKYSVVFQNCSTVVAQCLIVGWLGKSKSYIDRDVTDEYIATEMERLKDKVTFKNTRIVDRYELEERWYRYTNEAIPAPGRVVALNHVAVLVSLVVGLPLLLSGSVFGIPVFGASWIVALFAKKFDTFFWEPRLVHNIALYLKEEENPKITTISEPKIATIDTLSDPKPLTIQDLPKPQKTTKGTVYSHKGRYDQKYLKSLTIWIETWGLQCLTIYLQGRGTGKIYKCVNVGETLIYKDTYDGQYYSIYIVSSNKHGWITNASIDVVVNAH
jgi:hypothetical protein